MRHMGVTLGGQSCRDVREQANHSVTVRLLRNHWSTHGGHSAPRSMRSWESVRPSKRMPTQEPGMDSQDLMDRGAVSSNPNPRIV